MGSAASLPDFLIIGAAKSGTTSLFHYLKSHPEVFTSPIKEPRFFLSGEQPPSFQGPDGPEFNASMVWQPDTYRQLFSGRTSETRAGEASALYLWSEIAPGAIYRTVPDIRLIAILRNPVDRAYSHWGHNRRALREPLADFRAALAAEPARRAARWSPNFYYRDRGRYGQQLERYLSFFRRDQLLLLFYDDLAAQPAEVLRSICQFLGIDDQFVFDTTTRHNVTQGLPKNKWLHRLLLWESPAKTLFRAMTSTRVQRRVFEFFYRRNLDRVPPLDPGFRRDLLAEFESELAIVRRIAGRDLPPWR